MEEAKASGKNVSLWEEHAGLRAVASLDRDIEVDVCVVGAGVAGLTTAYLLGREGKKVVVLDKGAICTGETKRTTAHLSSGDLLRSEVGGEPSRLEDQGNGLCSHS